MQRFDIEKQCGFRPEARSAVDSNFEIPIWLIRPLLRLITPAAKNASAMPRVNLWVTLEGKCAGGLADFGMHSATSASFL